MRIYLQYCVLISIICSINCLSQEFEKKYCDKSLTDEKIAELEKCDNTVPSQIIEASTQCLKQMNKGTTYKDFMKTYCDSTTRKQYMNCYMKKMRDLNKSGITTESPDKQSEISTNIKTCMQKALGVKT